MIKLTIFTVEFIIGFYEQSEFLTIAIVQVSEYLE